MRKPTSVVHTGLGLLTAFLALFNMGLAAMLFFGFALYEYWSERCGHAGGYQDFWEALLGLAIGCLSIVASWLVLGALK